MPMRLLKILYSLLVACERGLRIRFKYCAIANYYNRARARNRNTRAPSDMASMLLFAWTIVATRPPSTQPAARYPIQKLVRTRSKILLIHLTKTKCEWKVLVATESSGARVKRHFAGDCTCTKLSSQSRLSKILQHAYVTQNKTARRSQFPEQGPQPLPSSCENSHDNAMKGSGKMTASQNPEAYLHFISSIIHTAKLFRRQIPLQAWP